MCNTIIHRLLQMRANTYCPTFSTTYTHSHVCRSTRTRHRMNIEIYSRAYIGTRAHAHTHTQYALCGARVLNFKMLTECAVCIGELGKFSNKSRCCVPIVCARVRVRFFHSLKFGPVVRDIIERCAQLLIVLLDEKKSLGLLCSCVPGWRVQQHTYAKYACAQSTHVRTYRLKRKHLHSYSVGRAGLTQRDGKSCQ